MPSASELCRAEETPAVGDLASTAKGSGARFNGGKPPVELLPLRALASVLWTDVLGYNEGYWPFAVIRELGVFQETGDKRALYRATTYLCAEYGMAVLVRETAQVLDYGRRKYAEWNWAKGMPWSVPLACAVRHCLAVLEGETADAESGRTHAAHVLCNILMLRQFTDSYPEGNDLPREKLTLEIPQSDEDFF